MKLHDDEINLNDLVYDVSSNRGQGRVIDVTRDHVEVLFNRGIKIKYTEDGKQKDKPEVTLYWRKPIILKTPKDAEKARALENFYTCVFDLCKNAKNFI